MTSCSHDAHSLDNLWRDLAACLDAATPFIPTCELIERLIQHAPERYSEASCFGRDLTPQRLGRFLSASGIHSTRDARNRRGYCTTDLLA